VLNSPAQFLSRGSGIKKRRGSYNPRRFTLLAARNF
jgi:hypothetical protein